MVFKLTTSQIDAFDNDGYLVLRKWVPIDLILQLRRASSELIHHGLRNFQFDDTRQHVAAITNGEKPFITRVNDLFLYCNPVFLELLGCPQIVNVATSLGGDDRISIYESLVVKNEGDGQVIIWHRDMVHNRCDRVFTLGVYLDEARESKGALRIIPQSQSSSKDVCTLEGEWKQGRLEAKEIEMDPGDVLVHDVMAVHSSEPITEQGCRRTVYFEFRSPVNARTNHGFTHEWIALRHQLIQIAQRRWQRHHDRPSDSDEWSKDERQFIDQLYAIKAQIEPGHYCFHEHPSFARQNNPPGSKTTRLTG